MSRDSVEKSGTQGKRLVLKMEQGKNVDDIGTKYCKTLPYSTESQELTNERKVRHGGRSHARDRSEERTRKFSNRKLLAFLVTALIELISDKLDGNLKGRDRRKEREREKEMKKRLVRRRTDTLIQGEKRREE